MPHARARTVAACALICGALQGFAAVVGSAEPESPVSRVLLLDWKPRMMVKDAVAGAGRRLARPACHLLFADFTDPTGRTLSANLEALGKTPQSAWPICTFVEGGHLDHCRLNEMTARLGQRVRRFDVADAAYIGISFSRLDGQSVSCDYAGVVRTALRMADNGVCEWCSET